MSLRRFVSLGLLSTAGALAGTTSQASQLTEETTAALCTKYEGAIAYVEKGEERAINCAWIHRLAAGDHPGMVEYQRTILARAGTLDGLVPQTLPKDMTCDAPGRDTAGRFVVCRTVWGEKNQLDVTYRARPDGTLDSATAGFDYKAIYREAMARTVARGVVADVRAAYIELQADLMLARERASLGPADTLTVEGDRVALVVKAVAVQEGAAD